MKFFLTLGAGLLISAAAYAGPVTYSTMNSSLCVGSGACGTNKTVQISDVVVTFDPVATASVVADPTTYGSFGQLVISCAGGGTYIGGGAIGRSAAIAAPDISAKALTAIRNLELRISPVLSPVRQRSPHTQKLSNRTIAPNA